MVWYADVNHQFNVSIPYLTIGNVSFKWHAHICVNLNSDEGLLKIIKKLWHFVKKLLYFTWINFLQITIRTSKFGPTLVILSTEASGGYILGFRVNPLQQLHITHKEISILRSEFEKFPIFGVEYTFEHQVSYLLSFIIIILKL